MRVGDMVEHQYGTLQGFGVILSIRPFDGREVRALWTSHGKTEIYELATHYLRVINAA